MLRTAALAALCVLVTFAAGATAHDSLVNLVRWTEADGGNGHWYAVYPGEEYFNDARQVVTGFEVEDKPGHLATITSPEENSFVVANVIQGIENTSIMDALWLGGHDDDADDWSWITGETWNFTNWAFGEPNNIGVETALLIWGPTVDPIDGLPGEWNNGLPNNSVNPLHRYWSVVEFGGPDDTIPQEEPDTLLNLVKWEQADGGNGHWYAVFPQKQYWDSARESARNLWVEDEPGYIATVSSTEENAFILNAVIDSLENPDIMDAYWLGGRGTGDSAWGWITDEPWIYTNWAQGEPNNVGIETALAMLGAYVDPYHGEPGQWKNSLASDDINPHARYWSIIEFGGQTDPGPDTLINLTQWPEANGGNDHWYGVIPLEKFWEDARELVSRYSVEDQTGYLATATSADEVSFIVDNVLTGIDNTSIYDGFWLGGVDTGYMNWSWVTGESWDFTNWAPGEPNNQGVETSVLMIGPDADNELWKPGHFNNALPNSRHNDLHRFWILVEFGGYTDDS